MAQTTFVQLVTRPETHDIPLLIVDHRLLEFVAHIVVYPTLDRIRWITRLHRFKGGWAGLKNVLQLVQHVYALYVTGVGCDEETAQGRRQIYRR